MADLPSSDTFGDYEAWPGRDVLDAEGTRLGAVEVIFLDESTKQPEWVRVELSGEGGGRLVMIPLAEARVTVEAIRVVHTRATVAAAPQFGDDGDRIDQDAERALYAHYGVGYSENESETGLPVTEGEAGDGAPDAARGAPAPDADASETPSVQPPDAPAERPDADGASRLHRSTPSASQPQEAPETAPPAGPEEPAGTPESTVASGSRQELIAGGAAVAAALAALAIVLVRRRRS